MNGDRGRIHFEGKRQYAYHVTLAQEDGVDVPSGMCVMHDCDNPKCVNTSHLKIASHAENMADMAKKGRSARGEAHGSAKLAEADVRMIRDSSLRTSHLSRWLGVSWQTVDDARKGKTWGHLE